MRRKTLLLVVFALLVIAGFGWMAIRRDRCLPGVSPMAQDTTITVELYSKGQFVGKIQIPPEDETYAAANRWLGNSWKQQTWKYDVWTDYAPSIVIEKGNSRINIGMRWVIAWPSTGGKRVGGQFIRPILQDDLLLRSELETDIRRTLQEVELE